MAGRVKRMRALATIDARVSPPSTHEHCALCERPLGRRIEWHHPVPKSRGGREMVPLHPICHRTIHACDKPPDFHAPTRRQRSG
jgi:hypothetical protein